MEATNSVELQAETLSGDVRDQFLDAVRLSELGWTKLGEHDQKRFIQKTDKLAQDMVRRVVDVIAHAGFAHVVIAIQDVGLGDALKIKATSAFAVDSVTKLASHGRGKPAVLVLADPSAFFGERAPAQADKDQPDLPMHDADGVIQEETKLELNELRTEGQEDEGEGEEAPAGNDLPDSEELPDTPETAIRRRTRARARADA